MYTGVKESIHNCLPTFSGSGRKKVAVIETPSSIRPVARHFFVRPNASKFRVGHDIVPNAITPCYDAAVLASYVASLGYDTRILDANALPLSLSEICGWIRKGQPDFVIIHAADNTLEEDMALAAYTEGIGISCIYWDEILAPYRVELIRRNYPFLRRILGEEPEGHIRDFLKPGEPVRELTCLSGGEGIDLNSLPVVDFSMLPMDRYVKWGKRFWQTANMRGCAWGKCTYCLQARESRQRAFRLRSIDNIRQEQDGAIKTHGVEHILFFSYEVNPSQKAFDELTRLMAEYPKVTWECYLRADNFSEETIRNAAKSGCTDVCIGVENVNSKVLESTRKNISSDNIRKLFKLAKKYGIYTTAMVMIGSPDETVESLEETERFVKELRPWSVVPAYLRVFPGTPVEKTIQSISDHDYLKCLEESPGAQTGTKPTYVPRALSSDVLEGYYHRLRKIGKGRLSWQLRFFEGFIREKRFLEEVLVRSIKRVGRR